MLSIAGKKAPIHVIVHEPKTEQGRCELAKRAAEVHADLVRQYIKNINCPSHQKEELLDAVLTSAKKKGRSSPQTQ